MELAQQAKQVPLKRRLAVSINPSGYVAIVFSLIAVVSFAIFYLGNRSLSFDDGDSLAFALALRDFDLQKQQPQPPGFPLYIASGRVLLALGFDSLSALTILSAVGGALTISLLVSLGYVFSGRIRAGLAASVVLAFVPVFWLSSEKALSDVPALAFVLLAIFALCVPLGRYVPFAALLAGLALGFRPHDILAVVPFAAYAVLGMLRDGRHRQLALFAGCGLAGVLVWLVPVSILSGGWTSYLGLVQEQSRHVLASDSIFASGPITWSALHFRALHFFEVFFAEAIGFYRPSGGDGTLWIMALVFVAVPGLSSLAAWRHSRGRLLVLWFVLTLLQFFIFESLDRPRLMLLFVPAMVLLASTSIARLPAPMVVLSSAICAVLLFSQTAPIVAGLSSQSSPPSQATSFVRANFRPEDTMLITGGSFRYAQYYLSEFKIYYLYSLNRQALQADVASGRYRQLVVFDRDEFRDTQDLFSEGQGYLVTDDLSFERDPRIHREHSRVRVVVLSRADLLGQDELRLPPNGLLQLGTNGDERFLGQGWQRRENVGQVPARWVADASVAEFRVFLTPETYRVRFFAASFPKDEVVTVYVNGMAVATVSMAADWAEYTFVLPRSAIATRVATVQLHHSRLVSPYESSNGVSSDRRQLAAAYSWFSFIPEAQ